MNPQNDNPLPLPDLDLVYVEGGTFTMGDEKGDLWDSCRPTHEVGLSSFYMCKYPVTQRLWQAMMGNNPSRFKGDLRPVETVSWHETQDFIKKLNGKKEVKNYLLGLHPPGVEFRLPTEAEWEFAARGGNKSEGNMYAGSNKLNEVGWYDENSYGETKPVGLKFPNELGIYDMSGNVWEWCQDYYGNNYYEVCQTKGLVVNPLGPEGGVGRVGRGGSCFGGAVGCRSADRGSWLPGGRGDHLGFRLVVPSQSVG